MVFPICSMDASTFRMSLCDMPSSLASFSFDSATVEFTTSCTALVASSAAAIPFCFDISFSFTIPGVQLSLSGQNCWMRPQI
jgi:hypothetical protein